MRVCMCVVVEKSITLLPGELNRPLPIMDPITKPRPFQNDNFFCNSGPCTCDWDKGIMGIDSSEKTDDIEWLR